jgi:hypothetical protein
MRKLEVLNTNYEKSGLYAKIPALNDMTLKEFFEGLNIVKNYDSVRTFNNAIETVDESILIDSSLSLISGHEYFSAFDLIFETMPADNPDSYRLWVGSEGVTDTITHSFLTNEKEVFMNVKTSASSRTADLYLNLFGLTIGQSMNLETVLYFIIDLSNLSFEVTEKQVYYYYRMYRYLKDSKSFDGFTYLPKGQSKYDVAYVNQTIDDPIDELNGHTLREVFEDGNLIVNGDFDASTNWVDSGVSQSVADGVNTVTGEIINSSIGMNYNGVFALNKNYFIVYRAKPLNDVDMFRIRTDDATTTLLSNPTYNEWHVVSTKVFLASSTVIGFRYSSLAVGSKLELDYIFVYDMNSFGISPETDMDYYYSLYQARNNITKKVLTYADIFEEKNLMTNYDILRVGNNSTYYMSITTNGIQWNNNQKYYRYIEVKNNFNSSEYKTTYYASTVDVGFRSLGGLITPTENEYHKFSDIYTWVYNSQYTPFRIYSETFAGTNLQSNDELHIRNWELISFEHFDELITKEQLDTMLVHYLLVKNIVIYPEIYVPIEPVGLGNRFKLLAVDDTVYGHELDFEDISFKMYFGVNFDAYKGYHAMMNMLRSNKAIIEYDWGIGPRYNDVRLLNAPKTEKDTSLLIISKFYFKRLNPFYELIEVSDEENMKNESDLDSPVKLDLTVSNTTVSIKLLDTSSGVQQEISFDFTGVSTPFNLTIDPETKKLLIDDITDAYDYADHTKDSFIYLPGDSEIYSINITGAAVNKITYKKWVIS